MTEQEEIPSTLQSHIFVIKFLLIPVFFIIAIIFMVNDNFLLFMSAVVVAGLLFFSLAPDESLLETLFDDNLEPGHSSLNPCPKCGEQQMARIQHKIYLPNEYRCENCGYKSNKEEAERSVLDATLAGLGEEVTSVGGIENDELREEVRDRLEEGWDLEEVDNENEKAILRTTKGGTIGGHALAGITTGLWTFGAGNVAYSKLSKKKNAERMVLRAKDNLPEEADEPKQLPDVSDKIRKLKGLNDDEIITDEEFEKKKKELLEKY